MFGPSGTNKMAPEEPHIFKMNNRGWTLPQAPTLKLRRQREGQNISVIN
jgi:hypothetical protein